MNSLRKLAVDLKTKPEFKKEFDKDPIAFLEKHPINEPRTFRMVVIIVASALLLSIIVATILVLILGKSVDDFFVMIGSTALGALVGLLAPKPDND